MMELMNEIGVEKKITFPSSEKANDIFNVIFSLPAVQTLHVAHQLNLFGIISHNQVSLADISMALNMQPRPTQALLSICTSLDLITLNNQKMFELTETAKNFLLKESPFYVGGMLDITIMNSEVYSMKSIKNALLNNAPQVYSGKELFQTNESEIELTKIFTRAMHAKSMTMAGEWPNKIDLYQNKCFLDIGGGSGAHSISVALYWRNLKGIIYDRPAVCEIAQEYIENFNLKAQLTTHVGDMWKDPFPLADIHFYSDIFHDWSKKQVKFLIQKSYNELKAGGRIIIHEMLFNNEKTGPLSVSSYNLMMLLWTQTGQQFSENELVTLLKESNFINIQLIPTGFGDWKLVTGIKENK